MGTKKGRRNVRKIEIPTDTPTECELGDTAADIQRRKEMEHRERGRRQRNNIGRGERKPGGQKLHSHRQRREWP